MISFQENFTIKQTQKRDVDFKALPVDVCSFQGKLSKQNNKNTNQKPKKSKKIKTKTATKAKSNTGSTAAADVLCLSGRASGGERRVTGM